MNGYNHKKIEQKWRKIWADRGVYKTSEDKRKKKFYILDMFPYPSGAGLHVGHPKGYIATDILSRYKKMNGYNVLHPMGWDAFGLPAEQFAIKNKTHPEKAMQKNIETFKNQMEKISLDYDWGREISTTNPAFYKWTQWTFIQMYKKGLVYKSSEPINWCPSCKTGLANEDLEQGKCERCGSEIEKKKIPQWVIRITDYADRLLSGIDGLYWQEYIKDLQRNWIGRSEGIEVDFPVRSENCIISVFTTRVDTIFSGTFLILAPEHHFIETAKGKIKNFLEVEEYVQRAKKKTDIERAAESEEKTGVKLDGVVAINPASGKSMSIWVSDFVLPQYGTGAIFANAHDKRDFAFAKKHGIPLIISVQPKSRDDTKWEEVKNLEECYSYDGVLVNSGRFNGLSSDHARNEISKWLGKNGVARKKVIYKLRDWVFSRQRYWGEPIPLVHCLRCGTVPVPENELPLRLPEVEKYEPTGTGESPLAMVDSWVNTVCPKCGGRAKRETNTMPQWAGSSWYYLRYIDPDNEKEVVAKEKEKYWSPVDLYVGGAEHATRHLIYARFWHKFLYDIGIVSRDEPFTRLQTVGLIIAPDGRKMSKRWGNVINPDEIIDQYGADALRIYEMFMGPFGDTISWNTSGIVGSRRFLDRVWRISKYAGRQNTPESVQRLLHKTIKRVGSDIEEMKYNTAISFLMIFINEVDKLKSISKEDFGVFLKILSPFAPHITQELWSRMGYRTLLVQEIWPRANDLFLVEDVVSIVVQVNGKVRENITVPVGSAEAHIKQRSLGSPRVKKFLEGKNIQKVIYVDGRLINFVT